MLPNFVTRSHLRLRKLATALGLLLVLAAFALPDAALAQSVSRGPYLQMGAPTSMTLRWRTNSATDSVVRYGPSPSDLSFVAENSGSRTKHEVVLEDLDPATTYFYSVGDSVGPLAGGDADHKFITSPLAGSEQPTRIWVVGDSGEANANARAVRDAYLDLTGDQYTNLFLMLGDNAYDSGTDSEYQRAVFDTYPTILRQTPLWPTLGNHDGRSANSNNESGVYYNIFTLPRNAEIGGVPSGTEAYYSFDYANIHFIVLESFETNRGTNGPMMNWLRADIEAQDQTWVIAFWHHPPYSKGSHNSDSESQMVQMRQNALPILEAGGVDLVLSGHSHSYERSFLIDGHYGRSGSFNASNLVDDGNGRVDGDGAYEKPGVFIGDPNQGAVYVVAGSSSKTSGGSLNHRAMFLSLNRLGSMVLEIDGDNLDATFLDNNGAARDTFRIAKIVSSPLVTVVASDPTASEVGADSGDFTLSRSGDTDSAVTVNYSVNGTATPGVDYRGLSGQVDMAAGQTSAIVQVTPIDDTTVERDETVTLVLSEDPAYEVGLPGSATVTIASDEVPPILTISATTPTADEAGPSNGVFTVTRTGDSSTDLTVIYTVDGSATAGTDYAALPGTLNLAAGAASATLEIVPIDDSEFEVDETVEVTLSARTVYDLGSPSSDTVTLASDDVASDLPVVSLSVVRDTAAEAGLVRGRFRLDRTGDLSAPLSVRYGVGGTATAGGDYRALTGEKTIKAGKARAFFDVIPLDDTEVEDEETVEVSLSPDAAYQVGAAGGGTVKVTSDDSGSTLPVVTIAVLRDTAAEAGLVRGRFRIDRTGATTGALTVRYAVAGTATAGDDYRVLSGSKTIKAGKDRAFFDIVPLDDALAETEETVVITVSADPAYQVGAPGEGRVAIVDNDQANRQTTAR